MRGHLVNNCVKIDRSQFKPTLHDQVRTPYQNRYSIPKVTIQGSTYYDTNNQPPYDKNKFVGNNGKRYGPRYHTTTQGQNNPYNNSCYDSKPQANYQYGSSNNYSQALN